MRAFEFKQKKLVFGRLPVKPTGKPFRTGCTAAFEFKFEFNRFGPISGQTGPVYRYRTAPVWPDRSVTLTLPATRWMIEILGVIRVTVKSSHKAQHFFILLNNCSIFKKIFHIQKIFRTKPHPSVILFSKFHLKEHSGAVRF